MASYQEFRTNAKRKRKKQLFFRVLIVILLLLVFLGIAYVATNIQVVLALFSGSDEKPLIDSSVGQEIVDPDSEPTQPDETPVVDPTEGLSFNGLVYDYPKLSTETAFNGYDSALLALPTSTEVQLEYFNDAIFIGDSLSDGFPVYLSDLLPATTRYYTKKSMGPMAFVNGQTWNLTRYNEGATDRKSVV